MGDGYNKAERQHKQKMPARLFSNCCCPFTAPHALALSRAVETPPEAEQQRILAHLHPALAPLLPHAMDTLTLVRAAYGQLPRSQVAQAGEPHPHMSEAVAAAVAAAGLATGGGGWGFSVGRHFSIRDLLKWCRRMASVRLLCPAGEGCLWPGLTCAAGGLRKLLHGQVPHSPKRMLRLDLMVSQPDIDLCPAVFPARSSTARCCSARSSRAGRLSTAPPWRRCLWLCGRLHLWRLPTASWPCWAAPR